MADITVPIIPWEEITLGEKLGEGGFGVVFKGEWQRSAVAIKQIKGMLEEDAIQELKEETGIITHLNSPFIIRLFGLCWEQQKYAIVMEFMPNASLFHLLHAKQEIPWNIRYHIAQDIACGLRLLHARKILHRDLKSLNVLLNNELRAKLTDFGLAKVKSQAKATSKHPSGAIGTIAWMAPELFGLSPKYSTASDVYAYAITSWELAAREIPYQEVADPSFIKDGVKSGERAEIPADCPTSFAELIQTCWSQQPNKRPTMDLVVDSLSAIIQAESENTASPQDLLANSAAVADAAVPAAYRGKAAPDAYRGKAASTANLGTAAPIAYRGTAAPAAYQDAAAPAANRGKAAPVANRGKAAPDAYRGKAAPAANLGTAAPAAYRGKAAPAAYRGTAAPAANRGKAAPTAYRGKAAPAAHQDAAAPAAYRGKAAPAAHQDTADSEIYQDIAALDAHQDAAAPAAYRGKTAPAAYRRKAAPTAYRGKAAPAAHQDAAAPAAYRGKAAPAAYQDTADSEIYQDIAALDAHQDAAAPAAYRGKTAPAAYRGTAAPAAYRGTAAPAANRGTAAWSCPLKQIHHLLTLLYSKIALVTTFLNPYVVHFRYNR